MNLGDLDLWRGEAYSKFFDFLDEKGGFYYEVKKRTLRLLASRSFRLAMGRRSRALHRCCIVRKERTAQVL
jgi:hypothetical protein